MSAETKTLYRWIPPQLRGVNLALPADIGGTADIEWDGEPEQEQVRLADSVATS
jgi:hypothetical protein